MGEPDPRCAEGAAPNEEGFDPLPGLDGCSRWQRAAEVHLSGPPEERRPKCTHGIRTSTGGGTMWDEKSIRRKKVIEDGTHGVNNLYDTIIKELIMGLLDLDIAF